MLFRRFVNVRSDGTLKRRGFKSIFRDEWIIRTPTDREISRIGADSALLALVWRFLVNLILRTYHAEVNGIPVCTYR